MASKRKPTTEPEVAAPEFPNPDEPVVITGTLDIVLDDAALVDALVGPEPERTPPPPGFLDTAPDIAVFAVVDDDDAERRRAIEEWKRVTPRSERLRHPFEG